MAWKTLAESLESALASMLIEQGGGAGAAPDARTKVQRTADAEELAQFQGETLNAQEEGADRCGPAGNKRARPTLAAGQHLFVIEGGGGRPARGGGSSRAAYARAGGGSAASNLRIVV